MATKTKPESRQRIDWRNFRNALTAIHNAYPTAKLAQFETGDQGHYGFTLRDVILEDGSSVPTDATWNALDDKVSDLIMDLDWDDTMEESEQGYATVDLTIFRPTQRFRIIRGLAANYKVVYYHDGDTRNQRAQHFADKDSDTVICEQWRESTMLRADRINHGWSCDLATKPA
jgi:hypothetical protein